MAATVNSREDRVSERAAQNSLGTTSEVSYAAGVGAAVAHAQRARAAGVAVPWVCVGPRNVGGRIVSLVQDPDNALTLYAGSAHGGLWRTTDGGDSWAHIGPASFNFPVGALAMPAQQRQTLYLGTGERRPGHPSGDGVYRVTVQANGQATFEQLARAPLAGETPATAVPGSALRYTRIETDPDDPEQFWAASQTGLWRCRATGTPVVAQWVRDFPPVPPLAVPAAAPALTTFALLGATDNFADYPPYATDLRVARDPRDATTVVLGGRSVARYLILHLAVQAVGVFRGRYDRSANTVAWDAAPTVALGAAPFPAAFGRVLLAQCRQQPRHLYVVFGDVNNLATTVFSSPDNGDNWNLQGAMPATDNGQADYSMILEAHPVNPAIVVCGTLNVALSSDGGANFTPILEWPNYDLGDHTQHADQHVALFDHQDRRKLWIGNDGGISMARDVSRADAVGPGYWRKRSHGIIAGQFQDLAVHLLPALGFMSAGGLQDNGSWVSYGGQTWYRCGWADGGGIAIHPGNPRQFLATQNGAMNLTTVTASLGVGADLVLQSRVINDLPLPDPLLRVRVDSYPSFGFNTPNLGGPFVGIVELDPRPANAGGGMQSWTADINAAGTATFPVAVAVAPPPTPLPAPAAGLPVAMVTALALPGAAAQTEVGETATALAFGPVPAAPPLLVEGWVGTSTGSIFHSNDAPSPALAANAWAAIAALPSVAGQRHAATRFAIHPTNPAMVAVAATQADRSCQIVIRVAGAPGVAQFQVRFFNGIGPGRFSANLNTSAALTQLPGTGLFIAFPAAAYAVGNRWFLATNGVVSAGGGAAAAGLQVLPAFAALVTVVISVAGAPGVAAFTFQVAGLPVQAAQATAAAVELPAAGLVLGFSGGPFVVGHSFTVNLDNTVTPVGAAVGMVEVVARLQGRVFLSYNRGALWHDISFPRTRAAPAFGADTDSLPPGPITSVKFDVHAGGIDLYAGTLAGVYRALALPAAAPAAPAVPDVHWQPFNGAAPSALPATLVNDLEVLPGTRRLRVATFGRGIWDCDLAGAPRQRLMIRQTLLEDGRSFPRPFPPPIPDDPRLPPGAVWLDHAHAFDIRIDSAPFEFFDDEVDGVEFDERMPVDDLVPLAAQAVYVQVHNVGSDDLAAVDVHLLFAPAAVAAPVLLGGAPPAAVNSMPAGLPDPATLVAPPDFNPSGASPWRRVATARRIDLLKAYEPRVVRFDWRPPVELAAGAAQCALVALCSAPGDALPALAAGTSLQAFIAQERRAALRVVPVRARRPTTLNIRDGVDDNARLGNVAFVGRSPDIIVVQAEPADPALALRDLLSTRPQDRVLIGGVSHVYVRVHNPGLAAADARVHVWSLGLDALGAPSFAPVSWNPLTPAAAPFLTVNVPAGGTALAHVVLTNPADPAPTATHKSIALVALIESADGQDAPPPLGQITDVDKFWAFFGNLFQSDNAALRVLRAVSS